MLLDYEPTSISEMDAKATINKQTKKQKYIIAETDQVLCR